MKGLRPGYVPLERALSKLGIASRTVARRWIVDGRVRVNGVLRRDPEFGVNPERARIEIDEQRAEASHFRLLLLHKPRGTVTTRSDEKGRPTVFELIREPEPHWMAVGRLDWATTGLLLLTTSSRLAAWLTDPRNGIPRTYVVTVRGEVDDPTLQELRKGVRDNDETLSPDDVTLRKRSRKESHLIVSLSEGKNREIRRMFAALGHEVTRLKRIAYGGLELGELAPGAVREVSREELLQHFPDAPLPEPR